MENDIIESQSHVHNSDSHNRRITEGVLQIGRDNYDIEYIFFSEINSNF